MKLFNFLIGSSLYFFISMFTYFVILTQCGMGPDSPVACNLRAVDQGFGFILVALAVYLGLSLIFWRRRDAGAQ